MLFDLFAFTLAESRREGCEGEVGCDGAATAVSWRQPLCDVWMSRETRQRTLLRALIGLFAVPPDLLRAQPPTAVAQKRASACLTRMIAGHSRGSACFDKVESLYEGDTTQEIS